MADKREAQRNLKRLQNIKTWQLFLLLILFGFLAATFLRLNNVGMSQRRQAVIQADKSYKSGDFQSSDTIKARLFHLQRFVTAHMNADPGVIYLETKYNADFQANLAAASGSANPGDNIYEQASAECDPKFGGYSQAYMQCITNYLNQFSPQDTPQSTDAKDLAPNAELYRYSFVSPVWTPDVAGILVLFCVIILFLIISRITGVIILKLIIKSRNRSL